jgi:Coenzyme PQQ synthesis protein D (PqqD)
LSKPQLSSSQVFWQFPVEEALVLARPEIQGLFLLNSTSKQIWLAYEQGVSVHSLAQQFSADFDIPVSQAAHDIHSTLDSWSKFFLIEKEEPNAEPATFQSFADLKPSFIGHYRLNGKQLRLEIADEAFVEEMVPRLAHLASTKQPPAITFQVVRINGRLSLFSDGHFFAEEPEASAARAVLLQEIARAAQPTTDWLALLHAGACGTDASCVIMPADTNVGKTTLTAALVHSGLHFLSDDSAAIDRNTMRVAPMPFALMVREGSWPVLNSRFPELASAPIYERNGWRVRFLAPPENKLGSGVPAKCLLFIEYRPGAATSLEPLTAFESLLRLQKSGFWVPHDRDSIGAFLSWMQSIPAYYAVYSDLDEATVLVHRLLADAPVAE